MEELEMKEIDIEVIKLSLELLKRFENITKENSKMVEGSFDKEWVEFVKKSNNNTLFEIDLCKEGLERILNTNK